MRISDWSSDVCSSDLGSAHVGLLEIRGLKKSFGSLVVLDGIDLDVEEGEIQGVIGPNGAGKSTLFNIINGIYTTGSGTISFRGRSIANKRSEEHTSELQSLMRLSYAVFCWKKNIRTPLLKLL